MEDGFFEYKAQVMYGDKECTELGVTYASDYATAMHNIEQYYGNTIVKITLYGTFPNSVYILDGPGREEFFDGQD